LIQFHNVTEAYRQADGLADGIDETSSHVTCYACWPAIKMRMYHSYLISYTEDVKMKI